MKKLLLILSSFFFSYSVSFGQTWTEQFTAYPVNSSYTGDISIVDQNIVWTMVQRTSTANHQQFSKTIDGGTTWVSGAINVGNTTGLGIGNITAVDANTAWVSAFPTAAGLATQGVYKTTDGGTTWTRQASATFTNTSFVNFVYFWDANNGVCMGDKKGGYFEIYTTTNGGTTWTRTPSANIATTPTNYGYTGKYYVNGNTIWFGTDGGQLMKSTDKGLNWTSIATPVPDFGGGTNTSCTAEFAFKDDNNGVILRENYDTGTTPPTFTDVNFYKTSNGGATWTEIFPGSGLFHGSIEYAGPNMLISGGSTTDNFGSSYSLDNGLTWTTIDGLSHTCLSFKSQTIGWGGGFVAPAGGSGGAFKFNYTLSNSDFSLNTNFSIYPNPSNSVVSISSAAIDSYKLTVADLTGKVLVEKSLSGIENSLDISSFSKGIYFFTLNSDKKSETIKVIKN